MKAAFLKVNFSGEQKETPKNRLSCLLPYNDLAHDMKHMQKGLPLPRLLLLLPLLPVVATAGSLLLRLLLATGVAILAAVAAVCLVSQLLLLCLTV